MCGDTHSRRSVEQVEVLANDRLTEGVGLVSFAAERIADAIEPGQFVHLRIAAGADFILRRPFSVHRAGEGRIDILYQVLGRGTRELSLAGPGDRMDAVGPLGTGWTIPDGVEHALIVAGGLGIAPMGMLVQELAARGAAVTVAMGAPTARRLLALDLMDSNARRIVTATDDGSQGIQGFVTQASDVLLASDGYDVAYACGPEAMCRLVGEQAAAAGVPCQVSLERLMACGIGACLSCVVMTTGGQKRACVDGPVFPSHEVAWDASETPPKH